MKGGRDFIVLESILARFVFSMLSMVFIGGEVDDYAASRTCDIIALMLQDAGLQDPGPKFIVGDLNATTSRIPFIDAAINGGGWIDVGACASAYGGIDYDTTCRANPKARQTRRDYVFANLDAKAWVKSLHVDHHANLPVHDVITLTLKGHRPSVSYEAVKLPDRIYDIFKGVCVKLYGDENIKRAATKREKSINNSKAFTVDVNLPPKTFSLITLEIQHIKGL
jgi:hypothetical protein